MVTEMGDKSVQKKNYIVEKAREVFQERGYKNVTMKDIVEACGISRGGLYLYYGSTKELFEAVLSEQKNPMEEVVQKEDATPGERLLYFLLTKKEAILAGRSLVEAHYEYLFEQTGEQDSMRGQWEEELAALEALITEGIDQEWMTCEDPVPAARNIMYTLEGMRIASLTEAVTAEEIDSQITYLMGTLGLVVE